MSSSPQNGGSVQDSYPYERYPPEPETQGGGNLDFGSTTFKLSLALFAFVCTTLVFAYIIFVNAGMVANPSYIMYNAVIYSSAEHSSKHRLESLSAHGLNPFEYKTAMVVDDKGKFYDIGWDQEILENSSYEKIPRINMNGAVISPGFADSHGHFMSLGLGFLEPDVRSAKGPKEFLQLLLSFCHANHIDPEQPSDSWLIGGRWDESQWQTDSDYDYYVDPDTGIHPFPTHKLLDIAFPKLGVALKRVDAHACFVNKVVLDTITIPDHDPPGGKIIRDADGNPTGIFIDYACDLVFNDPHAQPSHDHNRRAVTKSMQYLSSLGLTSVHDASMLNAKLFASHLSRGRELLAGKNNDGKSVSTLYDPFPVRIHAMVDAEAVCAVYNYTCPDPFPFNRIDQDKVVKYKNNTIWSPSDKFILEQSNGEPGFNILPKHLNLKNGRFDTSATKLMADGALGSWGAYLRQPYSDKPDTSGIQMYTQDQLNNAVSNLSKQGFQVCTHAIGDAAVAQVVDSYVYASKRMDTDDSYKSRAQFAEKRHRVEHFQIIPNDDPKLFQNMKDLSILPSMQSIHAVQDRSFAQTRLGKSRLENQAYLWSQIENEVNFIAGGTDFPVSSPNVIQNIYSSVTMQEIGHELPPFLPKNVLHIWQALTSLTSQPAYAQHREHDYGRIAKGYVADFVVIQKDWLGFKNEVPENVGELIAETKVLATFVDGNVVFEHAEVDVQKNKSGDFTFVYNEPVKRTKEHWYAARQPVLPALLQTFGHGQQLDDELRRIINKLKVETAEYVQKIEQQSHKNGNLSQYSSSLMGVSKTDAIFKQYDGKTDVSDEEEVILWSQMRFLIPANRIRVLYEFFINNKPLESLITSASKQSTNLSTGDNWSFKHQFQTFSDTPTKEMERQYGHHHHAKDGSKYRANTVYKLRNAETDEVSYIQPRVPPCIEHMGTREAAERKAFKYEHLEHIVLEPMTKAETLAQIGPIRN
jgi:predicted amidohydrolase YtcJ